MEYESSIHVQDRALQKNHSCSEEPIQLKELLIMTFEKIGFFLTKLFLWNT